MGELKKGDRVSDLVERLRDHALFNKQDRCLMFKEAAARIEALEAALREIRDQYLTPDQSSAIAKASLAPEQDK